MNRESEKIDIKDLSKLIIKTLKEKNLTLSFAESCTGGLNAHTITNISGASLVFKGGIVSYTNEVKMNILGVKEETLHQFGAVSSECAKEMAMGARIKLNADIGISTTGFASPVTGERYDVGTLFVGLSLKNKLLSFEFHEEGERIELKEKFSKIALTLLLKELS